MLEQALKDQIKNLFEGLKNQYTFQISVVESHPNRDELITLLQEVASCSEKINYIVEEGENLSFIILKENKPLSFVFRAVPTGHEFTSLLLAVLNADGIGKNLPDETIVSRIKNLKGSVEVKSYISLTCTNCPDVVQALNILSITNPAIKHEIIDGSIHQDEVEKLN
ncbi:MAG TPA: alkyl hydroperoxide reductase subunit F, partial [Bacteroidales bacterium]